MRSEIRKKYSVSWTIDKAIIKIIKAEAKGTKRSDSHIANKFLKKYCDKKFKRIEVKKDEK